MSMLDEHFEKRFAIVRHRSTVFGPFLDDYMLRLRGLGHPRGTIRRNLFLVTLFGEFVAEQDVRVVAGVTRAHVRIFLDLEARRLKQLKRVLPEHRASLCRHVIEDLLGHLQGRGLWRDDVEPPALGLMDHFYESLAGERGLRPNTIGCYKQFLDQFLRYLRTDGSKKILARITARDIDGFVVSIGRIYGRSSMRSACSAVRTLLRYLYREQILQRDQSSAVMMPTFYALERLPCALPWKTVRRLLGAVDLRTVRGRRDRTILLLLVTYGLRPGEIVKLRLEDFDWRHDSIRCRRVKAGRQLLLPLTAEVGEAVVEYLRHDRPPTSAREIFIRCDAPHVGLSRGSIVSGIVRRTLIRAGIEAKQYGAYVIRHSLAVHLVRKRHPLKTVTDVLGHRDPGVAYHYTKLSLEDLQGVALQAQEVMP